MLDKLTDQELIARANAGQREAFEALYYRYRSWVMAVANSLLHNQADAEEVLQDVFRCLFGRFPGFELTCLLKTFLYPVVRNRAIDILRKRKPNEELPRADMPAPDRPDEASFRKRITETVANLPKMHREVVILRFVDGLKLDEIADQLKIPSGTVKSRLNTALNKLREEYEGGMHRNNGGIMVFMLMFV